MERRVTSHTEEEEMNQRRSLLTLARKGDQKSIELLFELYQVKVFSGDALKKKKLPSFPVKPISGPGKGGAKASKNKEKASKITVAVSQSQTGEKTTKTKPASKGLPKIQGKDESTEPSSSKMPKSVLQEKPVKNTAKVPKKKASEKPQKLELAKKTRIAKKK